MADDRDVRPPTLVGKVAIITGASRGIGAGIAKELALHGAKIVATYATESSEKAIDDMITDLKRREHPWSAESELRMILHKSLLGL